MNVPRLSKPVWPLLLALALIAGACTDRVADSTTTSLVNERQTTTTGSIDEEPPSPISLRIGLVSPITTDNWWASRDTAMTAENDAFLGHSKTSLFTSSLPGFVYVPAAAATESPVEAFQEGDIWIVEQPIRTDLSWSDGSPLTANDLVFYFDTVREFDLGTEHASRFPSGVLGLTALDDHTVRIEFASQPDVATWNNAVGLAAFVPAHFWAEHVVAAREASDEAVSGITSAGMVQAIVDASLADDDPANDRAAADVTAEEVETYRAAVSAKAGRDYLYSVSGIGEPSAGSMIVSSREPGTGGVTTANELYADSGTERTLFSNGSFRIANAETGMDLVIDGPASGEVIDTYLDGPFVTEVVWVEHDGKASAYEQLAAGEIDFVLDRDGVTDGLHRELSPFSDLQFSHSQSEGFRYLAFNLRKPPMSDIAFRRATATVIDKEFIANRELRGAVVPAYTVVHPGLVTFHNTEIERAGWVDGEPMDRGGRYETAVQILKEAGYTWIVEPVVVRDESGEFVDVAAGEGITMPNGEEVPDLLISSPPHDYDPYRATFAEWIARSLRDLGVPVVVEPTSFEAIVETVFPPQTPESALQWDMYVLGWGAADVLQPGASFRGFFHSDQDTVYFGAYNTPGYASSEFDAAADAYDQALTLEEEAGLTKEMEAIIANDLPYVVLFRTQIIEAFRRDVLLPVDSIMGGHAGHPRVWAGAVQLED